MIEMWVTWMLVAIVLIAGVLSFDEIQARTTGTSGKALLTVNTQNDADDPLGDGDGVKIRVDAKNKDGNLLDSKVLHFDSKDNSFSSLKTGIPKQTRILTLTFINDAFDPPTGKDRNAFIDFFIINTVKYEAEDFDRTGGPDPIFPGCGTLTLGTGETIADCGNQGDFVEYDLRPGNPVGPGKPGKGPRP